MTYQQSIHIDAPVTKVFDFFRDPNNWAREAARGVSFQGVMLTQEGMGTHYTWVVKIAGISLEGFDVFTEFIPNRRITDRSSSSLEGTWTYSFESDGSGTKLTVTNRVGSFLRLPLLEHLLDRMTAKTHDPVFKRLKVVLEG
jgi:carbon monoxide dehydrogenase subunit G